MATVTVTGTPVTLDTTGAAELGVTNTGSVAVFVNSQRVRPGQRLVLDARQPLLAVTQGGAGTSTVDTDIAVATRATAGATPGGVNVRDYGATGDGTTDDTAALQAAIDAAVTAGGTLTLNPGTYNFTHLNITGSCRVAGSGVFGVYGNFANGLYNFTPLTPPFLTGTVLRCTANGQTAAIDILNEATQVDLADFGLLWATPFASTGHGIRAAPGTGKNGLASPRWDNIQVWGHDGNSYAFYLQNMAQGTFTHLRAWGGGLLRFLEDGGSQYGNSLFVGCMVKLMAGGTAHATFLSSTAENYTRLGFVGCEWNAVNGRNYPALTGYTFTNPTATQFLFNCPDGFLRGLSLVSPAFDNGSTVVGQPVFPHARSSGGIFLDPGGWYQGAAGSMYPLMESPIGDGVIPLSVEQVYSSTAATTLTATTVGTIRLANATTAAFTVTLPAANVSNGRTMTVKKTDATANVVTVASAGGTIDGATTYALATQYAFVTVVSDGTNWQIVARG